MANIDKAFPIAKGLSFDDKIGIFHGTGDPSSGGEVAPVGSYYLRYDSDYPQLWRKYGTLDTDWDRLDLANSRLYQSQSDPTGFENRTDSELLFIDGTRLFTIQPKAPATNYAYYINGERYEKTSADSITIGTEIGSHFIYFNGETLAETLTFNPMLIYGPWVFISMVYWDGTKSILLGDERHGMNLDSQTHYLIHNFIGTLYLEGLDIGDYILKGDGSLDTHCQVSLTNGTIADEDIQQSITHNATPSEHFEQVLSSVGQFPVIYRTGVNGQLTTDNAINAPLKMGTTYPTYNVFEGGQWITKDAIPGNYIAMWLVGTIDYKIGSCIKAFMGQRVDVTLDDALILNKYIDIDLGNFELAESKVLYRLIYKVGDFANSYNATLMHIADLRSYPSTKRGLGVISDIQKQLDILVASAHRDTRNTMINSLEIQALKLSAINSDLDYFVDSFDNADKIDASSTNFNINEEGGYVELTQGGSLEIIDTTKTQFDEGTFNNTESFIAVGGDGAIRKKQTIQGNILTLENFENITNVSTSGAAIQAQSSLVGTYYEGTASLQLTVDFSGTALNETSVTEIDLGAGGIDLSSYKFLHLYYLKQEDGVINYDIELEDTSSNTYAYTQAALLSPGLSVFQQIEKDLTLSFATIDETAVRYIRFRMYEQESGQKLVDVVGTGTSELIRDDREGKQSFKLSENVICGRIRLRVKHSGTVPDENMNIAITNYFGTTLGTATIFPGDVTSNFQDIYLDFDNNFNLVAGVDYNIEIRTNQSNNRWYVEEGGDTYANGTMYINSSNQGVDLNFTLYTPAIQEIIYIDGLTVESESTYQTTGDFESHAINLGITPDTLNEISWNEQSNNDTISMYVKFATTEGGLAGASWNGPYTNNPQDISGLTPYQWFQYKITWTGGDSVTTTSIEKITLSYTISGPGGSAIVISEAESTTLVPEKCIMLWEDIKGNGTINYYVSRDGKATWQSVTEAQKGDFISFNSGSGKVIHLKAIITGNAKLYGWGVATDKEFI